ncbi:MAG: DNA-directed RNA polymerase subunit omega [Acholeplasmatales bacterium]|jgi:DNA-directed RNA polymerase subunit omega|nr:DNA-directed RNA polymerase subunit omega [Acholeplasmatales bacterium]
MKREEGMRYPSIDDIVKKTDIKSRYKLVYAAGKLAKLFDEKKYVFYGHTCKKRVGLALEEIIDGRLKIKFEDEV